MPWKGRGKGLQYAPVGDVQSGFSSCKDSIAAMQNSFVNRTFKKDQRLPREVDLKELSPQVTGFIAWRKRGRDGRMKDRGWAEWIVPNGVSNDAPRILYFHGGGYKFMSPPQVRPTTARLAVEAGMPVLCIDYRKIPEHRHPAQIEDARSALLWLAANGPHGVGRVSTLFCAGDSAGGGLALGLAVSVRDKPLKDVAIAGIVVVSPMTDLTCSGESYRTRRWKEGGGDKCDPLFRGKDPAADSMPEIYELMGKPGDPGAFDLTEPEISPLHADLQQLPPTLIQVGDAEVMLSDSVDFGKKATAAGSPVEVQVYPRMWHCFHRFSEGCGTGVPLQEARDAMKRQATFLRQLSTNAAPSFPSHHLDYALEEAIRQHLKKDLVKGWEAHLRTVNGEPRRPLQKAAKDARVASDRMHAGSASEAAQSHYLTKVKALLQELDAAGESDFDGLLKEALVCLEGTGGSAYDLPPLDDAEAQAFDRIWKHRFGGVGQYKGHARDRDLKRAAELRQQVLKVLGDYQDAIDSKTRLEARGAYAKAVDDLRQEIEVKGEVDFDGLMRQAVRVLGQGLICKSAQPNELRKASTNVVKKDQLVTMKSERRWRPKGQSISQAYESGPSDRVMGA